MTRPRAHPDYSGTSQVPVSFSADPTFPSPATADKFYVGLHFVPLFCATLSHHYNPLSNASIAR